MKINIIKIGSASLMCDNHKVKTEVVKKLSKDVSGIINETNQRFIIVSSGAVEYGIALYKNEGIDYTTLEKADLAQAGQSELMNMWTREFKTYGLFATQCLLGDSVSFKHTSQSLIRQLYNSRKIIPIINFNDGTSNQEILHLIEHTDNDKTVLLIVEMFYRLINNGLLERDKISSSISKIIHETNGDIHELINNVILLTNTRGILDNTGNTVIGGNNLFINDIKTIFDIFNRLRPHINDGKSNKGTGGMLSKEEVMEILVSNGINTHIALAEDGLLTLFQDGISTKITFHLSLLNATSFR